MILRPFETDNRDPEAPWVIETRWGILMPDAGAWIKDNVHGKVIYRGRKVGFAEYDDAFLFYLKFCDRFA